VEMRNEIEKLIREQTLVSRVVVTPEPADIGAVPEHGSDAESGLPLVNGAVAEEELVDAF